MTDYYMLLIDDDLDVGSVVPCLLDDGADGQPNPAVVNPRAMPIGDTLGERTNQGLVDMVRGEIVRIQADDWVVPPEHETPLVRVAKVAPIGEVRPHSELWDTTAPDFVLDDTTTLEADDGWTVLSIEPLHTILGPQGELIIAAVREGTRIFEDSADGTPGQPYADEINRLYEVAYENALTAAGRALDRVGADGCWWTNYALGCAWGSEIIALAARDLVGVGDVLDDVVTDADGWTQDAYDLLTRAWRRTFPHLPLHPEDASLVDADTQ
jgi:hypothetical protein